MSLTIITNNVPRPVIEGYELTAKEREEFDYINWEENSNTFFRYRGELYDLSDFGPVRGQRFSGWHAVFGDSFFSGILIRYVSEENIVVGRYYA